MLLSTNQNNCILNFGLVYYNMWLLTVLCSFKLEWNIDSNKHIKVYLLNTICKTSFIFIELIFKRSIQKDTRPRANCALLIRINIEQYRYQWLRLLSIYVGEAKRTVSSHLIEIVSHCFVLSSPRAMHSTRHSTSATAISCCDNRRQSCCRDAQSALLTFGLLMRTPCCFSLFAFFFFLIYWGPAWPK